MYGRIIKAICVSSKNNQQFISKVIQLRTYRPNCFFPFLFIEAGNWSDDIEKPRSILTTKYSSKNI